MNITEELFPVCYDIGDWTHLPMLNTTGTRDKSVVVSPYNTSYYFKTSLQKGTKNYTFEFWSEVVASLFGRYLELPVLRYDYAIDKNLIGCISQNMVTQEEILVEGVRLITEFEPQFRENFKNGHHINKIKKALARVGLIEFKRIAVEMLLFDCIIGNTDRHSENWGLIRSKANDTMYRNYQNSSIWSKINFRYILKKEFGIPFFKVHKFFAVTRHRFAPFYDNGSSLGREFNEARIAAMLTDDSPLFAKFYNNGSPDIIICGAKTTFNETIRLLSTEYTKEYAHFVARHLKNYKLDEFKLMIDDIDKHFPEEGYDFARLSQQRKDFYVKLIDSRINLIKELFYGKI